MFGKKLSGRDIKIENCSLRLKRSIKKSIFWKFSFFQLLQNIERTNTVLGKKNFGRDIKIENCSLRRKISIKKSNFWKFSFFSTFSEVWTNIYLAWRKTFRQGYQNWKMQFSSHKINQKIKLLKVLFIDQTLQNFERTFTVPGEKLFGRTIKMKTAVFVSKDQSKSQFFENSLFFQLLQNIERTITVLGKKVFGRDIKIENCSLRLKRSIKKSNFWKFSFFSTFSEVWTNIYLAWRKTFRQGYQNWRLQSSSHKIKQKIKLLEVVVFSKSSELWTNNYCAWRENFRQGYQNWKMQFSSHKINQKTKLLKVLFIYQTLQNFERTFTVLGEKLFGRKIKIENCSLRLKRSIKKSISWKFSFFSTSSEYWTNNYRAWQKSFRQGYQNWKLQSSSQKINQKVNFLKILFFSTSSKYWTNNYRAWQKNFGRDIKIENCSLRLKRSIKKSNFWKFSFFSNFSEVWTNIYLAWRKTFRQGYQNWKLQSSSQKIKQKIKLLKNLFFFQNIQNFERTFTVLGEKIFGRVIKIEKCSFRLIRSTKKSNYWKFSLFIKPFRTLNEHLPSWRKTFRQEYQNWNCSLRLKRSIKKSIFWKFSFFSTSSEYWTNNYRAWQKSFRQGYQNWKLQSSPQKINQKIKLLKVLFFFQVLQKFERTFTVLGEKLFGRDIKIEKCSLRLIRSNKKSNCWKISVFSKSSELWTDI